MEYRADIGIIGAGPAGARAAELLAAAGARVVMLDPKAPWEKPCGGGLTDSAFDEFPELEDLKPAARRVASIHVQAEWDEALVVPLHRPIWILSRRTLGRWQLDRAVRAGAEHLPLRVTHAHRTSGGWSLETSAGHVAVPFLLGADGAASLVRRAAAPDLVVDLAPTRVAYPEEPGPTPDAVTLRFYSDIAGYLWDFPRPDHRSVGIVVPNGTWQRPRLDGEIDQYRAMTERDRDSDAPRVGAVIGTALLGHGDYSGIAGEDFALLGDAAGFADPFTGEGIQNALRSAGLFVHAWAEGDPARYPRLARKAFEHEFKVSRMLQRSLFERGAGLRLVERALRSRGWCALVGALMNAVNEHDARISSLLGRWAETFALLRSRGTGPEPPRPPFVRPRADRGARDEVVPPGP
ncbi:MAG: FAD-dependent monooxygenase [Gemmatimonadetes bacterium]|nr:FAD-dependent monooxygenase [Gemmatimonadota bacterium]